MNGDVSDAGKLTSGLCASLLGPFVWVGSAPAQRQAAARALAGSLSALRPAPCEI